MMTNVRKGEILHLVDQHNRGGGTSPFIAQILGKATFTEVARQIGVPAEELSRFLVLMEFELPQDYLFG